MALSKAEILGHGPKTETLNVPALGGEVHVRGLSARAMVEITSKYGETSGDIPMLIYGVVDDDGKPLFTSDDLGALMDMDWEGVIRPMLMAVKRLTGLVAEVPKAPDASS